MSTGGTQRSILIVRLGAMGDVLHALPAVASLKQSFPEHRLIWTMAPQWMALVEKNPFVDEVIPFQRRDRKALVAYWRQMRELRPELAIDFQGLVQSALVGRAARPKRLLGWDRSVAREPLAAFFYTQTVIPGATHVVDWNLEMARVAGARMLTRRSWIPPGVQEGVLPQGPFVLTNPLAGWKSKQWPLENYELVARKLQSQGVEMVANVPPSAMEEMKKLKNVHVHGSSIAGLIAATRQAAAVLGVDSGPLHLAAALRKPGVALFGPTDPARNGPYGGSMSVLRAKDVTTTYKREDEVHPSMKRITPEEVAKELIRCLSKSTLRTEAVREP